MERECFIKRLIKEKGMSLKSFSEFADIPYTTLYSMLERGIGKASVDNVIKVCRALGITVDELDSAGKSDFQEYKITTIAAHNDVETWTEEELEEIEKFKAFVKMKKTSKQ